MKTWEILTEKQRISYVTCITLKFADANVLYFWRNYIFLHNKNYSLYKPWRNVGELKKYKKGNTDSISWVPVVRAMVNSLVSRQVQFSLSTPRFCPCARLSLQFITINTYFFVNLWYFLCFKWDQQVEKFSLTYFL